MQRIDASNIFDLTVEFGNKTCNYFVNLKINQFVSYLFQFDSRLVPTLSVHLKTLFCDEISYFGRKLKVTHKQFTLFTLKFFVDNKILLKIFCSIDV